MALVFACAGTPAAAAIVSGELTAGTLFDAGGSFLIVDPIPAGFMITDDSFNDNFVRGFAETQGSTLTSDLVLDDGATLVAGTVVASDYFFVDPATQLTVTGSVRFANRILGIAYSDDGLARSDILQNAGVIYGSADRRSLDRQVDRLSFNGRTLFFTLRSSSPGDSFRVLTAVPEPSSWAMMVVGFGLSGAALRRRRRAVA